MMPIKFSLTHNVKRSAQYQTVESGLTVERELADGETLEQAFRAETARIAPLVEAFADASLYEILNPNRE